MEVVDVHGVRVVTPFSQVHKLPYLGRAMAALEWQARSAPGLKRLGGCSCAS